MQWLLIKAKPMDNLNNVRRAASRHFRIVIQKFKN